MKKYLSILVIGIALILPMSVGAATVKTDFTCDKKCTDNGDTCQTTCKLALTGDSVAVTSFSANLNLSPGLTIDSIKPAEGFTNMGTGNTLQLMAATSTSGTRVELATIVINVPKDAKDCKIELQPTGYANVTVDVKPEENPKTGATIPLAIIACGAVAACGVYVVSKKNTKLYKI